MAMYRFGGEVLWMGVWALDSEWLGQGDRRMEPCWLTGCWKVYGKISRCLL